MSGRNKLDSPEEFFDGFDNEDLDALLDESFDVDENIDFTPATSELSPDSRTATFVEAAQSNELTQGE